MKPIIGINMNVSRKGQESASLSLGSNYVDAVTSAGGFPLVLPPIEDEDAVQRQVELCDGIVLIGGADINPARYGREKHPAVNLLDGRRETYDFALIDEILKKKKPFLAICLGSQEINVALGGTLIQDLPTETSSTVQHRGSSRLRHDVVIRPDTRLSDIVATETLVTNTSHHQAIETAGRRMRVTAHCTDGTTEAFELLDYPFGLGIQWHPERLTSETQHLALFRELVEAASNKDRAKNQNQRNKRASGVKR